MTYYLCVAALQFLAPLFIILFVTLLTKSTGNYTWNGGLFSTQNNLQPISPLLYEPVDVSEPPPSTSHISPDLPDYDMKPLQVDLKTLFGDGVPPESSEETIFSPPVDEADLVKKEEEAGETNKVRLELFKNVFNTVVLRGLNNFGLWWLIAVWFATTTLGYIYHNQFRTFL